MLKKIVASEFLVFIILISKDLLTAAHLRDYRLNDPSNGQQPNYWLIIGRSALEMIKLKIVPLPTAKLFVQSSDFCPICACYLFLHQDNLIGVLFVCMCVCICAVLHCRHLVDPLQSEVLCCW